MRTTGQELKYTPKISVIIPCYNYGHYLGQAIESVLKQSFADFELIVCDDGSTDNTKDIVNSFRDSRIIYLYQLNKGFPTAHNLGLFRAQGKYFCPLDADDWWLTPSKLEYQYTLLERDPSTVMTYARASLYSCDTSHVDLKGSWPSGHIFNDLLIRDFIPFGTIMVPTDLACKIGFDERVPYMQDYPFKLKVAALGRVEFWDETVMAYRQHAQAVSKSAIRLRENTIEVLKTLRVESYVQLAPRRIWRQALSLQHFACGKEYELVGELAKAKSYYLATLKLWPFNWKAIVLLGGIQIGGLLRKARSLKNFLTIGDV